MRRFGLRILPSTTGTRIQTDVAKLLCKAVSRSQDPGEDPRLRRAPSRKRLEPERWAMLP